MACATASNWTKFSIKNSKVQWLHRRWKRVIMLYIKSYQQKLETIGFFFLNQKSEQLVGVCTTPFKQNILEQYTLFSLNHAQKETYVGKDSTSFSSSSLLSPEQHAHDKQPPHSPNSTKRKKQANLNTHTRKHVRTKMTKVSEKKNIKTKKNKGILAERCVSRIAQLIQCKNLAK